MKSLQKTSSLYFKKKGIVILYIFTVCPYIVNKISILYNCNYKPNKNNLGVTSMKVMFSLLTILLGVVMSIQGNINNQVGKIFTLYGMVIGVSIIQIVGVIIISKGSALSYLGSLGAWQVWLSGAIGISILVGLTKSISVLGSVAAFSFLIVGQIIFSAVIDTFGLLGQPKQVLTSSRAISIVLMMTAVVLLIRDSIKTSS